MVTVEVQNENSKYNPMTSIRNIKLRSINILSQKTRIHNSSNETTDLVNHEQLPIVIIYDNHRRNRLFMGRACTKKKVFIRQKHFSTHTSIFSSESR